MDYRLSDDDADEEVLMKERTVFLFVLPEVLRGRCGVFDLAFVLGCDFGLDASGSTGDVLFAARPVACILKDSFVMGRTMTGSCWAVCCPCG